MKKYTLLFLVVLLSCSTFVAQELKTSVKIQTPVLQLVDPKVFQTLESQIQDFMNNQKWTDDEYEEEERILVDINMTIAEEITQTSFKVDFAIQATRPVYGSNYDTPIFTHIDKEFTIQYEQFAPIDYSENSFTSNLSSLLSFYANIIIGLDYDSFSPYGGEPYFQITKDIVNNIPQNLNENLRRGWRSIDGNQNRYWLMDNLLSPRGKDFRQAWYDYHRQALDIMYQDVNAGRAILTDVIKSIGEVNRNFPNAFILRVFSNTKAGELVEIYKKGVQEEQNILIQTMSKVDPANAAKYRQVK